jgi:hypothetical protein
MKKWILPLIIILPLTVYSQVTDVEKQLREQKADSIKGWKTGGIITLNFSQTSFTNWAAGGQNSVAGNALFSVFANFRNDVSAWDNILEIGYGKQRQGSKDEYKLLKTDDKFDFTSKYGRNASEHWYYAGLLNFKTQLDRGYNYPNDSVIISDWLAPGYLMTAIGMDYKPGKVFTMFLSPLTGKMTFVSSDALADAGSFGIEPATYDSLGNRLTAGKHFRQEFGGYIRMTFNKDIMKNVTLASKADFFFNYLEKPENIDVSWEVLISMKVNKYISATISTQLIYDDDVDIAVDENDDGVADAFGPRIQFKEILGVGFSYKF